MSQRVLALVGAIAIALLYPVVPVWAAPDPSCRGGVIANGPFSYSPADLGAHTFVGTDATAAAASFTITAPGEAGDTVFPAQSGGPCQESASAEIRVFGIEKVADGDGNMLGETVDVPIESPLGLQIAAAFFLDPSSHLFGIGETLAVSVGISNPLVGAGDFGDYVVTLKAQAIGAGIGVGSGTRYMLGLRAPAVTDTVPPTVTINKPSGDEVLGPVAIEIHCRRSRARHRSEYDDCDDQQRRQHSIESGDRADARSVLAGHGRRDGDRDRHVLSDGRDGHRGHDARNRLYERRP